MVFPELLLAELRHRGISLRELADLAGVNHTTLSKMINHNQRPAAATVRKLAPLLGKTEDELLTLAGYRSGQQAPARPRSLDDALREVEHLRPIAVPVMELEAGQLVTRDYEYLPPQSGGARHRPHYFAMRVTGDEMVPLIGPGDTIIVDPDTPAAAGRIVVAIVDGTRMVVMREGEPVDDPVQILGVVIRVTKAL